MERTATFVPEDLAAPRPAPAPRPQLRALPPFEGRARELALSRTLAVAGLFDQALLLIMQMTSTRMNDRVPDLENTPRSVVLDVARVRDRWQHAPRAADQLRQMASAAGCVTQLVREWKGVLQARPSRHPRRYYQIASLAAASLLIPWLMVRKR